MSGLRHGIVVASTLLVLAFGLSDPQSMLAATLAVAIAAVLAMRVTSVVTRELPIGVRASSHRQLVDGTVEPSHPRTPGRPLGRAPSGAVRTA